jgi:putative flippase GtrA
MHTFTKAQVASLLASGVDFLVAFVLLKWTDAPRGAPNADVIATFCGATGTLCGGVTHFLISRVWVFSAKEKRWTEQVNRYALVWIGNLILNGSALYLLVHYTKLDHMIAKIITSILVAVCYNYILQKRFVFKH